MGHATKMFFVLSGLAKAFFHAGSKTFLVSHSGVLSEAVKRLATGMFAASDTDATMGPSEALRRSMSNLMQDEDLMYAIPYSGAFNSCG